MMIAEYRYSLWTMSFDRDQQDLFVALMHMQGHLEKSVEYLLSEKDKEVEELKAKSSQQTDQQGRMQELETEKQELETKIQELEKALKKQAESPAPSQKNKRDVNAPTNQEPRAKKQKPEKLPPGMFFTQDHYNKCNTPPIEWENILDITEDPNFTIRDVQKLQATHSFWGALFLLLVDDKAVVEPFDEGHKDTLQNIAKAFGLEEDEGGIVNVDVEERRQKIFGFMTSGKQRLMNAEVAALALSNVVHVEGVSKDAIRKLFVDYLTIHAACTTLEIPEMPKLPLRKMLEYLLQRHKDSYQIGHDTELFMRAIKRVYDKLLDPSSITKPITKALWDANPMLTLVQFSAAVKLMVYNDGNPGWKNKNSDDFFWNILAYMQHQFWQAGPRAYNFHILFERAAQYAKTLQKKDWRYLMQVLQHIPDEQVMLPSQAIVYGSLIFNDWGQGINMNVRDETLVWDLAQKEAELMKLLGPKEKAINFLENIRDSLKDTQPEVSQEIDDFLQVSLTLEACEMGRYIDGFFTVDQGVGKDVNARQVEANMKERYEGTE